MTSVTNLGRLLGCEPLTHYLNKEDWFDKQDEIKRYLRAHLAAEDTVHWMEILEAADIWCAKVYNWEELMQTEGFQALNMLQTIEQGGEVSFETTRCPIRVDGESLFNEKAAPSIGEQNRKYGITQSV